jgi:hypothetical protein
MSWCACSLPSVAPFHGRPRRRGGMLSKGDANVGKGAWTHASTSKLSTGSPRRVQRKKRVPSCSGRRPAIDCTLTFHCTSTPLSLGPYRYPSFPTTPRLLAPIDRASSLDGRLLRPWRHQRCLQWNQWRRLRSLARSRGSSATPSSRSTRSTAPRSATAWHALQLALEAWKLSLHGFQTD